MPLIASLVHAGSRLVAAGPADTDVPIARPEAKVETVPVPSPEDAADDPAIWIHPTNPEKSLLIDTDKQDALHVYNMDGSEHQVLAPGSLDAVVEQDEIQSTPKGTIKADPMLRTFGGGMAEGLVADRNWASSMSLGRPGNLEVRRN
ncbi:MAG: phytase [Verrucomicrobiota bacterium]|nr:phytase [Verrucomicrobiota bacterium]